MVAERRLLMVATYVSELGTGASVTGATWTGIACIGGGAAGGADLHPATRNAVAPANRRETRRVLRIKGTVLLLQGFSVSMTSKESDRQASYHYEVQGAKFCRSMLYLLLALDFHFR